MKKIVIIVVAAVLLVVVGLGGGLAAGMLLGRKPASGEAVKPAATSAPPNPELMYDMPILQVTLAGEQVGGHFVRIELSFVGRTEEDKANLEAYLPRVIDSLEAYLQTKTMGDLRGRAGLASLRAGIASHIRSEFVKDHELTVLFRGITIN